MSGENYVVISADCHGGGNIADYRPYLESRYLDDFDAWLATFENPYDDLAGDDGGRNWDSARRLRELEADGVVAEVIFPNTVPPFFPKSSLVQPAPGRGRRRPRPAVGRAAGPQPLAGRLLRRRAGPSGRHLPDHAARRRGLGRRDPLGGRARAHRRRAAARARRRARALPPLYAPDYEPIWSVCEEVGLPINHHSGSAAPDYGDYPAASAMFLLEVTWWAHRTLWHLLFSGVMERHPDLQFVFTEQGTAWLPDELTRLDYYHGRLRGVGGAAGSQEAKFGESTHELSLKPSEYWARQCHLGSSFIRRPEVEMRHQVGVDRIMWGSDFPHLEGCWPYSRTPPAAGLRRACPRTRSGPWSAPTRRGSTASTSTRWRRSPPSSDRRRPRSPSRSRPSDIPDEALRCPAFAAARFQVRA